MPKRPRKKKADDQVELFKAKAREIGADKSADLSEVMRRLAGQKRHEDEPEKKKPRR